MDKQTHRFMILAGLGLLVLGTGACKQEPPPDEAAPVVPVSRKPKPSTSADGQAAAKPGTPAAKGKDGGKADAKKGPAKKGSEGGPAMAKGKGDPFAPGGMQKGATPGAPGTPAAAGAGAVETPRMLVYNGRREDPFLIDWKLPVPPPYVFDEVEPIRLASPAIETPHTQPYEVREQPELRVSGIMTGDGVFAILESGGNKVDVVKPGSSVEITVQGQTNRTYKVVSITKDKVKLRSQVGNVIYTQEVPLSDVAVGTAPRSGFGPGGGMPGSGGMPSSGGGFGNSGGFPGFGGSGGPGRGRPGGSSGRGGGASPAN